MNLKQWAANVVAKFTGLDESLRAQNQAIAALAGRVAAVESMPPADPAQSHEAMNQAIADMQKAIASMQDIGTSLNDLPEL